MDLVWLPASRACRAMIQNKTIVGDYIDNISLTLSIPSSSTSNKTNKQERKGFTLRTKSAPVYFTEENETISFDELGTNTANKELWRTFVPQLWELNPGEKCELRIPDDIFSNGRQLNGMTRATKTAINIVVETFPHRVYRVANANGSPAPFLGKNPDGTKYGYYMVKRMDNTLDDITLYELESVINQYLQNRKEQKAKASINE